MGTLDEGTCFQVSQIIGMLQAPSGTFVYPEIRRGQVGSEKHTLKKETQDSVALQDTLLSLMYRIVHE